MKAKFKVGQVVAVWGIPEIKEAEKFLGYHRIDATKKVEGKCFYIFAGQSIRESRLQKLTKRECGA